jgi:spermidine synthase
MVIVPSQQKGEDKVRQRFWVCLLTLGTSSVSVQLVMIREVMSSFSGNELVIGLVLGTWLLFTGLGSALGVPLARRAGPEKCLFGGHILIALLPFLQVAALRGFPLVLVRGEMVPLPSAVISSAFILLPFCLVSGAMIPLAGALLGKKGITSKVYIADTIGDIAGGLLFSLIFVYTLSHWETLATLGFLNLFAAAVMSSWKAVPVIVFLGLGMVAAQPLEKRTLSWRFPGQEVSLHKNTPFAQLTITRTGKQLNVLQDAIPLFSTNDLEMEAVAHLPLCQVPRGARVLLVSGGVFGTIQEMAKHEPQQIDYVELDPAILALDRLTGNNLAHPFVRPHVGDGRLFIKKSSKTYDAVVVDLPDPENTQLNRFYTQEFFEEAKAAMSPGGVLLFTLVGAENYLEEKGLALNRSVFSALQKTFDHVLVFPGITHYYLASTRPLTRDIGGVLARREIHTSRLVPYDLVSMTDPFRIDLLRGLLTEDEISPNRDLSPRAFGHLLDLWLKKTGSPRAFPYVVSVFVLGFALFAGGKDRVRFTILTSGYAGMAFELSLLLLFQVIYGYVYLRICAFITLFMIGSALGAFASGKMKRPPYGQVLLCDGGLVALALLAGGGSMAGIQIKSPFWLFGLQYFFIPSLILMAAFLAGCQFSAASRIARGTGAEITGRLYLADLAGASCGTILTGLFFLPKIGIMGVLVSVALLKSLSLGVNVLSRKPHG